MEKVEVEIVIEQ